MLNVLYKYLVLNKTVDIPNVGNFSLAHSSAALNDNSFQPPATVIKFESATALADRNFYNFLATEQGISEVEAVRKFQDFSYQLKKNIQSNNFVELSGMGVLKRNSLGELVFEQASKQNYFPVLTPLKSESKEIVSTEENVIAPVEANYEQEEVINKDRWWIWATVLAVLAIAAIAYVYWQESM